MQNLFKLLQKLDDAELHKVLAKNDLYKHITEEDIKIFPDVYPDNFVNICNFADYYQPINELEFLENIRFYIHCENEKVMNALDQIPKLLYQKIYDFACLPYMSCKYGHDDICIEHISCYRYFKEKYQFDCSINRVSAVGALDLVKYLYKIDDLKNMIALENAIRFGHLEIVKYFIEDQHLDIVEYENYANNKDRYTYNFNICYEPIRRGNLDVLKYLVEVHHLDVRKKHYHLSGIEEACEFGYFDMIEYVFGKLNFECYPDLIQIARRNGRYQIAKYLTNYLKNQQSK